MGVLTSQLFTEGDTGIAEKLEDCAIGWPNEVRSHFALHQRGEHIKRVQQALKNVARTRPELGIPDFEVNGVYDEKFAKAVYAYKEKKDIRNFANKIDNIVGIKTIRSLDSDNQNRPHVDPPPRPVRPNVVPRPAPNCVTDANCPASQEFDVQLLGGGSGGEIADLVELMFTIRDTNSGLGAIYKLLG